MQMPSIQVKDVPDDVHQTMRRRATENGMSLQEYLLARLGLDPFTGNEDFLKRNRFDLNTANPVGRKPRRVTTHLIQHLF